MRKPLDCSEGDLEVLRRTKDAFLVYGRDEELVVAGYTDASLKTGNDDCCSQSGYMCCHNGGAVSWRSSKQSTAADSTIEYEYIVAAGAVQEACWTMLIRE